MDSSQLFPRPLLSNPALHHYPQPTLSLPSFRHTPGAHDGGHGGHGSPYMSNTFNMMGSAGPISGATYNFPSYHGTSNHRVPLAGSGTAPPPSDHPYSYNPPISRGPSSMGRRSLTASPEWLPQGEQGRDFQLPSAHTTPRYTSPRPSNRPDSRSLSPSFIPNPQATLFVPHMQNPLFLPSQEPSSLPDNMFGGLSERLAGLLAFSDSVSLKGELNIQQAAELRVFMKVTVLSLLCYRHHSPVAYRSGLDRLQTLISSSLSCNRRRYISSQTRSMHTKSSITFFRIFFKTS